MIFLLENVWGGNLKLDSIGKGGPPWGPHWHGAFSQRGPASKLSQGELPWLNYQIREFKLENSAKKNELQVLEVQA